MDRFPEDLDSRDEVKPELSQPAIPLGQGEEILLSRSVDRLALPERLFALEELDVLHDLDLSTLWTFMRPRGRPSFTRSLLADFEAWQSLIANHFGPDRVPLRFLVLGSRTPGVFCFGGDLELFHELIRSGDRDGLKAYGYRCVEILNRNMHGLELPIVTVGLVQGQALGGGFEALLSFDHIVAERGSTFGLPETTFGLFPGMGAHMILTRKVGAAIADRIIMSNQTYSAEQMYDLGIVHHLAEPGEGVAAVRDFIKRSERRHSGMVNSRRAARIAAPIHLSDLYRIVDLWVDSALALREQDLKIMRRLVDAQVRLANAS